MKKAYEDVKQMLSSYAPPASMGLSNPIPRETYQDFFDEYEQPSPYPHAGYDKGDVTQDRLTQQMVGVTQPTGRRRLRSMGQAPEVRGELPLARRPMDAERRGAKLEARDTRRQARKELEEPSEEEAARRRFAMGQYPFVGPNWRLLPKSEGDSYDRQTDTIHTGLSGKREHELLTRYDDDDRFGPSMNPELFRLHAHELGHHFQNKVPFFENAPAHGSGHYGGSKLGGDWLAEAFRRLEGGGPPTAKNVRQSRESTYATELAPYAMMNYDPTATAADLMQQTQNMSRNAPRGNYPNVRQRILANLPRAAMDKRRILDEQKDMYGTPFAPDEYYPEGKYNSEKPLLTYPRLAGLRARLGGLPPREQWEDAVKEQMAQDEKVRELRGEGKKKDIIDLLTRNKTYKTPAEPMDPFDQAWALLKMPLVPGSFTRDKYGITGKFRDPVTGEMLDAMAYEDEPDIDDNYTTYADISDPNTFYDDMPNVKMPVQRSSMWTIHSPGASTARPKGVETKPDFRRRGYASAMHDMLAYLHDKTGKKVKRHSIMTDAGSKLWDDKGESWPVREDLE